MRLEALDDDMLRMAAIDAADAVGCNQPNTRASRGELVEFIIEKISDSTTEQQEGLQINTVDVYNSLVASPDYDNHQCEAFGQLYDEASEECRECCDAFVCRRRTIGIGKTKKIKLSVAKKNPFSGAQGFIFQQIKEAGAEGIKRSELIRRLQERIDIGDFNISSAEARVKKFVNWPVRNGLINKEKIKKDFVYKIVAEE